MRENSLLEGNPIFRDKDRKLLKLPQLRRAGVVAVADVIQDDGSLRPRPDECAQRLTLAMEWEAVRKYVWPTVQRLCYEPKSDLETVRREATMVLGEKALTRQELKYKKIVSAIRSCPPPMPPRWSKAEPMRGSTKMISHNQMKKWAIDTRTRDFVFRWNAGLLYARKDLWRFGIKDSHECKGCNMPEQTIEHLFWHCTKTRSLLQGISTKLNIRPAALDPENDNYIGHLSMKVFHIIYVKNFEDADVGPDAICAELRNWLLTEKAIREKKGQMALFLSLWSDFIR
jgi:hypothetical protein